MKIFFLQKTLNIIIPLTEIMTYLQCLTKLYYKYFMLSFFFLVECEFLATRYCFFSFKLIIIGI